MKVCNENLYLRIRQYKGKAIPLQAWRIPEDSRSLSFLDFTTNSTWRW